MEKWLYKKGDQRHGPVNSADLKRLAEIGRLGPDDLVRKEGMAEWAKASEVAGIFAPPPMLEEAAGQPDSSPKRLQYQAPGHFRASPVRYSVAAIASLACGASAPVSLVISFLLYVGYVGRVHHSGVPDVPTGTRNLAYWLMVLGLISVPLLCLSAIVFGIVGIRRTGRGKRAGRRLAISGLVIAILWFAIPLGAYLAYSISHPSGVYDAWNFGVSNATYEQFSSVSVDYNGRSFGCGTGDGMSATLPGDMPRSADIVMVGTDGTTHRVHVTIPRPPVPDPRKPFYSGIPEVYFVIHGEDSVEVTFLDPMFKLFAPSNTANPGK
jgi:hypothetical protein